MANEVQRIDFSAEPTIGAIRLVFDGQTTTNLSPVTDNVSTVRTALEALSNIGSGNIGVVGDWTGFTFTFQGTLANTNVDQITVVAGDPTAAVSVARTQIGGTPPANIQLDLNSDTVATITFGPSDGVMLTLLSSYDTATAQATADLAFGSGNTIVMGVPDGVAYLISQANATVGHDWSSSTVIGNNTSSAVFWTDAPNEQQTVTLTNYVYNGSFDLTLPDSAFLGTLAWNITDSELQEFIQSESSYTSATVSGLAIDYGVKTPLTLATVDGSGLVVVLDGPLANPTIIESQPGITDSTGSPSTFSLTYSGDDGSGINPISTFTLGDYSGSANITPTPTGWLCSGNLADGTLSCTANANGPTAELSWDTSDLVDNDGNHDIVVSDNGSFVLGVADVIGQPEVQTLTLPDLTNASGGFNLESTTLTIGQTVTGTITAADVQNDFSLGGNLGASGSDGGPFTLVWNSNGPQSLLTIDTNTLTGPVIVTPSTTTDGSSALTDVTGSITNASGLAGSILVTRNVNGTISNASGLTGSLNLLENLTGSIAGTSGLTGSIVYAASLTGAISNTSGTTGSINYAASLTGSVTGTSNLTGSANYAASLTGSVTGTSDFEDTLLEVNELLTGSTTNTSDVEGNLNYTASLTGSISNTSDVEGSLADSGTLLTGTISNASGLAGSLEVLRNVDGTLSNSSGLASSLEVNRFISGDISNTSDLEGTINLVRNLTGAFSGSSSLTGSINYTCNLTGNVNGTSNLTGNLNYNAALTGSLTNTSAIDAAFGGSLPLNGTLSSSSSVADASLQVQSSLTGSISNTSNLTANPIVNYSLTANCNPLSNINANLVVTYLLTGLIDGTTVLTGLMKTLINPGWPNATIKVGQAIATGIKIGAD